MHAAAAHAHRAVVDLLQRDRAVVEAAIDRGRATAVVAIDVEGAQRVVDDEVARAQVARPGRRRLDPAVLVRRRQADVVDAAGEAATGDDVDRSGDGAGPGLGGGRAQDLDALDLIGRQRVEREAGRDPLPVEKDLGVAAAQAAQPDRAAAAGPALDRDAGQALQHLAQRRVAVAVDLVAADDDLGRRRLAPLLQVVRPRAPDLDGLEARLAVVRAGTGRQVRRRRRSGRRRRRDALLSVGLGVQGQQQQRRHEKAAARGRLRTSR
jgi:hypothetical protein